MSDYRPHDRDRRGSRNGGGGDYYDAPPPPSSSFRDGGRPYPPPPRDDFYDDRGPPPPRRGGDDRRGGDFGGGGGRRGGGGGGYDDRRGGYRGGYDDDRVGPMRSPEYERGDGGRGKRRRSPSPAFRRGGDFDDRPPRGDNGDFRGPPPRFRDDRRGPPRGGRDFDSRDGPPPPPSRPSLEAPHTLPYQVTLSYFRDWFAQTSPPSLVSSPTALDEAWKKYEADFLRRDAKGPFEAHRGERWFRDKYEPGKEMEEERRERRKVAREGRVKEWVERAKNGELDGVAYDFDEELVRRRAAIQPNEATLAALGKSGSPSLPQNGTTTTTSTEVKTDDASMPPAGEADVKPKTESTPKIKDSSLPPTEIAPKVSQANPEMIVVPAKPEQICVARVPPEVSIKELESLFTPFDGFTRLAVSAAAPHAGFLRLAWATFSTAEQAKAAMDTIAAAAVKPEEPAATGEAKVEGTKDGEEKPSVTGAENGDGEMTNGDAPSTTAAAAPSDPKDTPLDPSALPFTPASTASSVPYSIGSYTLTAPSILSILTVPFEARIRATPSLLSSAERVRDELEKVGRVVEALESQAEADGSIAKEGEGEGRGQRGSEVLRSKREVWERELEGRKEKEGLGEKEVEKEKVEIAKRSLDLSLSYLRAAFDTCYYCCVVCDSPEQLADLCPRHVRRADNGGNEARRGNEAAWLTGFDKRLPLLFPRTSIDIRDFGGESRDEELYRLVQPHVKQEEEGKFRCKECSKLFSARKFVEKHIALKHGEFIGPALEKVDFFNNYILDPSRLPLAQFQRENYLPSILAPPPPPRRSGGLADRIGPKRPRIEPRELDGPRGPPPPPPAGQKMDPRAGRGASSYADLDGAPGGGDIVLPY